LVSVDNDASAQFRVLSHQLYGNQDAHPIVRLLIITEILNSPALYERYIALRGVDVQEYVSIMSLEECRGDHLTLAAFANAFNVDLLVYSPAYKNPLLLQCRNRTSAAPSAFSIAMMPNDDYASLVSINAVVTPPKRHVRHKARSPAEAAALAATTEQLLTQDLSGTIDPSTDAVYVNWRGLFWEGTTSIWEGEATKQTLNIGHGPKFARGVFSWPFSCTEQWLGEGRGTILEGNSIGRSTGGKKIEYY